MQTQLGALAEYMVRICETGSGYTKSFFGAAVKYVYWNRIINSCYFCLGGICKFTKEQKGTLSWLLLSTDRQRKDIIYLSMVGKIHILIPVHIPSGWLAVNIAVACSVTFILPYTFFVSFLLLCLSHNLYYNPPCWTELRR